SPLPVAWAIPARDRDADERQPESERLAIDDGPRSAGGGGTDDHAIERRRPGAAHTDREEQTGVVIRILDEGDELDLGPNGRAEERAQVVAFLDSENRGVQDSEPPTRFDEWSHRAPERLPAHHGLDTPEIHRVPFVELLQHQASVVKADDGRPVANLLVQEGRADAEPDRHGPLQTSHR